MNTSKENFLKSAVLSVKQRFGLNISLEKLTEIVGDKMDSEWQTFTYNEVSEYMDTSPCEDVADLICLHYTGAHWPTNGDRVDFNKFWDNLMNKMKEDV